MHNRQRKKIVKNYGRHDKFALKRKTVAVYISFARSFLYFRVCALVYANWERKMRWDQSQIFLEKDEVKPMNEKSTEKFSFLF